MLTHKRMMTISTRYDWSVMTRMECEGDKHIDDDEVDDDRRGINKNQIIESLNETYQ